MREILFRGKEDNSNSWRFGIPMKLDAEDACIIESLFRCEEYMCCGANMIYVEPETIGEFTGLTDKNGAKIFEGDILDTPNGKWLVVAVRGGFGVVRRSFMSDYDAKMGFHSGLSEPQNTAYTEENAEVIGNIHDNPELLEDTK